MYMRWTRRLGPIGHALGVFSALILLALLWAPRTGWIVRQQLRMLVAPPRPLQELLWNLGVQDAPAQKPAPLNAAALKRFAERHLGDWRVQLGFITLTAPPRKLGEQAFALATSYPLPAAYAAALRYDASGVQVHRPEEDLLSATPSPYLRSAAYQPPLALLTRFQRSAREGERLDPSNAFFPFMLAGAYFAGHQDHEGLAAVLRAGSKPIWNDYTADDSLSQWRLVRDAMGRRGAINRVNVQSRFLMPHFALLRSVARVSTGLAVQDELAGRRAPAIQVRLAVMRVGDLMRAESASGLGTLVGTAIVGLSMARPGGAPPGHHPTQVRPQERVRRVDAFAGYLHSLGQDKAAEYAREAMARAVPAKNVVADGLHYGPEGGIQFDSVVGSEIAGAALLESALWFLLAGIGALILARTRNRWAALLGGAVFALALTVVAAGRLASWGVALGDVTSVTIALEGGAGGALGTAAKWMTLARAMALPAVACGAAIAAAVVRRRPPLRAFGWLALAAALLLSLSYTRSVASTARAETAFDRAMDQVTWHEGSFLAGLLHRPWPGDTPRP